MLLILSVPFIFMLKMCRLHHVREEGTDVPITKIGNLQLPHAARDYCILLLVIFQHYFSIVG